MLRSGPEPEIVIYSQRLKERALRVMVRLLQAPLLSLSAFGAPCHGFAASFEEVIEF